MDRRRNKTELMRFLRSIQRPDQPLERIEEHEGLVESGLVDSLAVIQIVVHLEATYGIDFAEHGLDPQELRSVGSILDLIERRAA